MKIGMSLSDISKELNNAPLTVRKGFTNTYYISIDGIIHSYTIDEEDGLLVYIIGGSNSKLDMRKLVSDFSAMYGEPSITGGRYKWGAFWEKNYDKLKNFPEEIVSIYLYQVGTMINIHYVSMLYEMFDYVP
jgi:hypothetical protein